MCGCYKYYHDFSWLSLREVLACLLPERLFLVANVLPEKKRLSCLIKILVYPRTWWELPWFECALLTRFGLLRLIFILLEKPRRMIVRSSSVHLFCGKQNSDAGGVIGLCSGFMCIFLVGCWFKFSTLCCCSCKWTCNSSSSIFPSLVQHRLF